MLCYCCRHQSSTITKADLHGFVNLQVAAQISDVNTTAAAVAGSSRSISLQHELQLGLTYHNGRQLVQSSQVFNLPPAPFEGQGTRAFFTLTLDLLVPSSYVFSTLPDATVESLLADFVSEAGGFRVGTATGQLSSIASPPSTGEADSGIG
jgi:hypothetical protein